ncbi:uncharacterized protein LOC107868919 [Capsicum annuum]|uniref:uncharacterized protein LOC107868919 n=1 Tax=Capsicum annuum TaxID=4072 RepID=UPI0007BF46DA|nr:uncharacterized protein LOC107868919 [Capsicum annuum]
MGRAGEGAKIRKGKGATDDYRLRVGSWNRGSLLEKSLKLVKILRKRQTNIVYLQETKWISTKARVVDGYKLWYSGSVTNRNGVGILVDDKLRKKVVEVKRVNNRMMSINLVIGGSCWNIISGYAPYIGLDDENKKILSRGFEEIVRGVPSNMKLFIGGGFNGHIGSYSRGYRDVHRGYGFGVRNVEGVALLDFARAFGLAVVNSTFTKKEVHLVTFCSSVSKTQIDFLLLRKGDRGICKDCKVLSSESLSTQHRLLVMGLDIRKE